MQNHIGKVIANSQITLVVLLVLNLAYVIFYYSSSSLVSKPNVTINFSSAEMILNFCILITLDLAQAIVLMTPHNYLTRAFLYSTFMFLNLRGSVGFFNIYVFHHSLIVFIVEGVPSFSRSSLG